MFLRLFFIAVMIADRLPIPASCAETKQILDVSLQETRSAAKEEDQKGLHVVERKLTMDNLSIRYLQLVDPQQGDRPVFRKYGDYFLSCGFPSGHWNWDLEYFLDVSVKRANQNPVVVNRASLQEGMYILEHGKRSVADMVWPLRPMGEGNMVVRLIKVMNDPTWFFLQITIEGAPDACITQVRLGCYPFTTAGPPERERWVTTLTNAYQMTSGMTKLNPVTDWGLVLHNKLVHEEGGCLLVFDPESIETVSCGGIYPISTCLTPCPDGRRMELALGYFWDMPYDRAAARFRKEAAGVLERLRKTEWTAKLQTDLWLREKRNIDQLLSYKTLQNLFAARWASLVSDVETCLVEAQQNVTVSDTKAREANRRFHKLMKQAQEFRETLYEHALKALIEEAMK